MYNILPDVSPKHLPRLRLLKLKKKLIPNPNTKLVTFDSFLRSVAGAVNVRGNVQWKMSEFPEETTVLADGLNRKMTFIPIKTSF